MASALGSRARQRTASACLGTLKGKHNRARASLPRKREALAPNRAERCECTEGERKRAGRSREHSSATETKRHPETRRTICVRACVRARNWMRAWASERTHVSERACVSERTWAS
eukprot:3695170-Pleurochrysis_carterae.AAC.1